MAKSKLKQPGLEKQPEVGPVLVPDLNQLIRNSLTSLTRSKMTLINSENIDVPISSRS
jgi:hypothetical protein